MSKSKTVQTFIEDKIEELPPPHLRKIDIANKMLEVAQYVSEELRVDKRGKSFSHKSGEMEHFSGDDKFNQAVQAQQAKRKALFGEGGGEKL